MTRTTKKAAAKLNAAISGAVKRFAPPESLTVDEWADKHRRLSPESSAEAGPWRTKRTPYLEEPMKAFTDPKVHKIVMVAASQVGKSELELNIIGYIIDQDPGSILYVHPTIDDARKFSRLRVAPMIRDSKPLKAKGPDLKLGNDYELADYLVEKIRDEKYSPEAAVGEAEVNGWRFKTKVCASTVYNYIRGEVFGDELTTEMLPQGGKRKPARKAPEGTVSRAPAGKSIEQRPKEVDTRETFGHWEMDSVESCQGVSNTLLVLTERKTRKEIIIPLRDKTSASVVRALNGIERKVGALFPKIFASITVDNGCEFADAAGMEKKRRGKGKRTEIYYCHPYTPSERGSNENQNGLIRRHIPKGTDLSQVSPREVKQVEEWLNNYPRKMFGFLCAEQLFRAEIAALLPS